MTDEQHAGARCPPATCFLRALHSCMLRDGQAVPLDYTIPANRHCKITVTPYQTTLTVHRQNFSRLLKRRTADRSRKEAHSQNVNRSETWQFRGNGFTKVELITPKVATDTFVPGLPKSGRFMRLNASPRRSILYLSLITKSL